MSDNDKSELKAFRELETLVRHLGEELATFRRRALTAEATLKERAAPTGGHVKSSHGHADPRATELEAENEKLRTRLASAEDRVRQTLDRVRFLRQQMQTQATGAAGNSK